MYAADTVEQEAQRPKAGAMHLAVAVISGVLALYGLAGYAASWGHSMGLLATFGIGVAFLALTAAVVSGLDAHPAIVVAIGVMRWLIIAPLAGGVILDGERMLDHPAWLGASVVCVAALLVPEVRWLVNRGRVARSGP